MKISFKILTAALLTAFLTFTINSCKKSDKIQNQNKRVDIPKSIIDKLKSSENFITLPVNKKAKGFVVDANGNVIVSKLQKYSRTLTNQEYCDDPSSAEPDDVDLVSIESRFICGSGYLLTINWKISTVFTFVNTNPNNSSQLSKGRLRLKNGSGTTIYQNLSITPIAITSLGTDPNNSEKTIYNVSFTTPYLSQSLINQTAYLDNSYFIYSDCSDTYAVSTGYISSYSFDVSDISDPCQRIDNAQITPDNSVNPPYEGYVAGSDVLANCSGTGYVHNDGSYIEYTPHGTSNWTALPLREPGYGTLRTSGKVYYWEIMYIEANDLSSGSGTYDFRYRNFMDGSGCSGPWSAIETHTF